MCIETPSVFLRVLTPYSNIQGNLCGFLLALITAVPAMYSQPLHLHGVADACHAPFDNLQRFALSLTPSFPAHHLASRHSAAKAFPIIHLVTEGKATYHPPGNESSYHEGLGGKKRERGRDICQQILCVVDEFKHRTPGRFSSAWQMSEFLTRNVRYLQSLKQAKATCLLSNSLCGITI